ncbi:MAG TPA: acyl carrier protein [Thermomicrobiaceae bacterium]|nr:acyl carrier protein [Thermomicrobiaceae bacterium]
MVVDYASIRSQIRDYVTSNFQFDGNAVDDAASLMGEGILDSTGVLEMVLFVEETFGVPVLEDEVLPENFDSVAALTAFIERKGGRPREQE